MRPSLLLPALVVALACAGGPGQDSGSASDDPDAAWSRAFATATRAHRSHRMGDLVVAETQYERALAAAEGFPADDPRTLETRTALARLHHKQGRYRQAVAELAVLVPDQERVNGAGSQPLQVTLLSLCGARIDAGRADEGRRTCQRLLGLQDVDPATAAEARTATILELARAERRLRRFDDAEARYRAVLDDAAGRPRSAAWGALTVRAHTGLGLTLADQRRFGNAESEQLKALSILVRRRAWRSPEYPTVLRDLGDLHVATRRYDEARERYDRALEHFRENLGAQHFEVRDTLLRIADLLVSTGQPREAAELRYTAEAIPDPRT